MYAALALAVVAVALLAALPILRRERRPAAPGGELPARHVEWGALGVRVFSWIAGTALVLAAAVLLSAGAGAARPRPALGVGIALLAGIALLIAGERWTAPRYRLTSNALAGAGIGILYAACYAALARWQVPALPVVIAGMLAVSVAAV
ncbi:MAG: DUF2339 domain-containing protein, partial [Acidobacteria bacterium]|nr:DUF2339 domain-containing protein [Acidobacteriota bacterium]